MSPLWRDEVGIHLAQRRVCLLRLGRGLRPTVLHELDSRDAGAGAGWDAALGLLERELGDGRWSRAWTRVVIADHWARYTVVPWSDTLTSAAERREHARELMAGVFGDSMSDWVVAVSAGPPGQPRLASAMPSALLQGLRETALRH